jgi:hypothetical protein
MHGTSTIEDGSINFGYNPCSDTEYFYDDYINNDSTSALTQ